MFGKEYDAIFAFLGEQSETLQRLPYFWITVLPFISAVIASWLTLFILPWKVLEFMEKDFKIFFMILFFILLIPLVRIFGTFAKPVESIESGVMSSFAQKTKSEQSWLVWIIAGAISVTHTFVYFVVALSFAF